MASEGRASERKRAAEGIRSIRVDREMVRRYVWRRGEADGRRIERGREGEARGGRREGR